MTTVPYRPSSGTEGADFQGQRAVPFQFTGRSVPHAPRVRQRRGCFPGLAAGANRVGRSRLSGPRVDGGVRRQRAELFSSPSGRGFAARILPNVPSWDQLARRFGRCRRAFFGGRITKARAAVVTYDRAGLAGWNREWRGPRSPEATRLHA